MNKNHSRWMEPLLTRALGAFPVVVVAGARQVGKTTLVRELCPGPERRYHTLDSLDVLLQARENPDSLLEELPVTLDEVQRAPELLLAVKRVVDRKRVAGGILLTGSANFSLMREVADSLAGRAVYLELSPFCPSEWDGNRRGLELIEGLFSAKPDFEGWRGGDRDWRRALCRGGFPSAMGMEDEVARGMWFGGYVQTYLERDWRQLSNVGSLGDFQTLMRLAAGRTGRLLNESDLARDAGISQPTCHRHMQWLEVGCLISRLEAFHANAASGMRKARKLMWQDGGLAAWLAGIRSAEDVANRADVGFWLEQAVFQTLQVWRGMDSVLRRISHWREGGKRDVDFVLESPEGLVALEVKNSKSVTPSDCVGLRAFRDAVPRGRGRVRGVVLYGGEEPRAMGEEIHALPWSGFFG
jgi:predicted AAA+ superfamily ATPase